MLFYLHRNHARDDSNSYRESFIEAMIDIQD